MKRIKQYFIFKYRKLVFATILGAVCFLGIALCTFSLTPVISQFFASCSGALAASCIIYLISKEKSKEKAVIEDIISRLSELSLRFRQVDETAYLLEMQLKFDSGYRKYSQALLKEIHLASNNLEETNFDERLSKVLPQEGNPGDIPIIEALSSIATVAEKMSSELSFQKNISYMKEMQKSIKAVNIYNRKLVSAINSLREKTLLMD